MNTEPDRLAVWHGPGGAPARLRGALPAGLRLQEESAADGLREVLARPDVTLGLVDWACRDALPAGGSHGPDALTPVVVVGCPDAAAVEAALTAGAVAGLRFDAGEAESAALLATLVERSDLARAGADQARELERQRALALKDDLTAAYNRRFFDRCLDEELARARRTGSAVALIFMDLDDLKSVNQRWGHSMGSAVLREAAARTIRTIRTIDKVVRYGGDEFCIVLPGSDAEGGREVAERIRQDLEVHPFVADETGGVTLTASFGIAAFPEHAQDKEGLVAAADEAMFRIKDARKNGILVAGAEAS